MKTEPSPGYYPPYEEKLNILTHGFGLGLSVPGLVFLIIKAVRLENPLLLVSFSIFGASMILLYAASTFYHSATNPRLRYRLNIFDHTSIYLLIAGTYTPFALVTLNGFTGWIIFAIVWAMALTGCILKLFYTGKYNLLSTIMYLVMGWIIVFAVKPLVANLDISGLLWLVGGGLSYTVGAGFFLLEKVKYNHAIFHLFVLLGSFCHYITIYFFVVP